MPLLYWIVAASGSTLDKRQRNVRLMSRRLGFYQVLFRGQVRMEQDAEQDTQGQQQHPQGLSQEQTAADGTDDRAAHKVHQHQEMLVQLLPVGLVGVPEVAQLHGQANADLAHMVGGEGGGHGRALSLPEGIILHGSNKIDGHLGNLHRGRLRQESQHQHHHHFDGDQQRIPPHGQMSFDGVGQQLREERAQGIGGNGNQIVKAMPPVALAEGHAHQDDVTGLGVTEYITPQNIGKRPQKSCHADEQEVNPVAFTHEVVPVGFCLGR